MIVINSVSLLVIFLCESNVRYCRIGEGIQHEIPFGALGILFQKLNDKVANFYRILRLIVPSLKHEVGWNGFIIGKLIRMLMTMLFLMIDDGLGKVLRVSTEQLQKTVNVILLWLLQIIKSLKLTDNFGVSRLRWLVDVLVVEFVK